MSPGLHPADVAIVVVYLLSLAAIGAYFARRQSLDGFLVAGRSMRWLPVGLSLMAALNSGIDYLTQPSATITYGFVLTVGIAAWLFVYLWVSRISIPFYSRLNFYTAYEYLEVRFDVRVRVLAAAIFVIWRLGWMATALYVPSLAISTISGGRIDLTTFIVVLGTLVTLYTMLGGIKAVIWSDVVQFGVMFAGLTATVLIVLAQVPGGVAEVWSTAAAAGKTSLWVALSGVDATLGSQLAALLFQPITVPALMSALVVGRIAQYTSDQVMVQRLQTARSGEDARKAFIIHAWGDALWMVGLSLVGLALFAYMARHDTPEGLASDQVLPYFMGQFFPVGAVGLVTAAILAASLSSIDSAIHSCSSVVVVDLYNRLWHGRTLVSGQVDGRDQLRATRIAVVATGILGTTLACNVSAIGGLLEIANKLINSFTGPLLGIFLFAMFSRRAKSFDVLVGGLAGAITSYLVAYHSGLSFLWPSTFGLLATLLAGFVVRLLRWKSDDVEAPLTWSAVMQRAPRV
jgi:SSS family transporter